MAGVALRVYGPRWVAKGNAKGPSVGSGLLRNVIGLRDGEKAQAGVGYGEVAEAEG